jgi:broad specificity phosphatase PhoE
VDVFLVRHAKAGSRHEWEGPDDIRPLSKKGRKQADRVAYLLGDRGVTRILSSPSVRCVETVQPLAERLGVKVEETDALAEGARPDDVVTLARQVAQEAVTVLCTHGDVIPLLLDTLVRTDQLALPDDYPCAKGSTWRLRADGSGRFVDAEYIRAS